MLNRGGSNTIFYALKQIVSAFGFHCIKDAMLLNLSYNTGNNFIR
ncbi:hypothetical protein HMP0721_0320 [Pseudoramibacter alactolyticus ATCC 23263]|uniref:Uncharacterized protein n=1 Tax=Pseudoramibacter alactolyticus ATCC 23263 TaxID=887929 RepID=E6ME87_9FIRM|nr:hypothetical protein HMP0721_0320 [Pseudoramibacter alactolyticus ATCC 23263]